MTGTAPTPPTTSASSTRLVTSAEGRVRRPVMRPPAPVLPPAGSDGSGFPKYTPKLRCLCRKNQVIAPLGWSVNRCLGMPVAVSGAVWGCLRLSGACPVTTFSSSFKGAPAARQAVQPRAGSRPGPHAGGARRTCSRPSRVSATSWRRRGWAKSAPPRTCTWPATRSWPAG